MCKSIWRQHQRADGDGVEAPGVPVATVFAEQVFEVEVGLADDEVVDDEDAADGTQQGRVADEPGEDVSVSSFPSVEDFLMEFGDAFSLDGVRGIIELRRELLAEDFCSFSSIMLSSLMLGFFLVAGFSF